MQCLATMQNLNENYLVLCGNWENSFQVISMYDGKIVQSIHQHKDLVSCVAGIFLFNSLEFYYHKILRHLEHLSEGVIPHYHVEHLREV